MYKARAPWNGSLVALEVFPPATTSEELRSLRRDVEILAAIRHPHLRAVHEVGETPEGGLFVSRELCEGETLRTRLERRPLVPEEAIGLASQIAAALGRAHEAGLVHRSLGPAHILVTPEGQAKVAGFGLVALRPAPSASDAAYLPPEQLRGGPVDARTNLWSLGVLLYEMLTGRLPFRRGELEPLSALQPGLPAALDDIVSRALAQDPDGRPSMDELLVVLRETLAGGGLGDADSTVVQVPVRPSTPSPDSATRTAAGSPLVTGLPSLERSEGTIAQYRLLGLLGQGGMGVIYKAEDTRLRRTVALKFLATELTRDPVSKARFLQEAQAASALDHANICTIYEVAETEGRELYLAMAFYEGETIEAKIARGPLPFDQAVDVARQVAQGLAKAHRGGIVHRDIKPANLMVTEDGVVKILDFGIAKLRGSASPSLAGSFLGTPAYMSPEQARGEEVDARTDIWSLGVVLFEMLTGAWPFRGTKGLNSSLQAILRERPRSPSELRPGLPPQIERVVEKMLAKSPADRYATAAEALADLTALQLAASGKRTGRRALPWAAAALLALGGLAAGGVWLNQGEEPPIQGVFTHLTSQEGREEYPTLSPDGTSVVYVRTSSGQRDLFLQRIDGGAPTLLTPGSPADDTQPAFSPDGKTIAFRSERREGGGIYLLDLAAATVRRVTDFGFNPAWSPDGGAIAVATEGVVDPVTRTPDSQIWRVDLETGRRRLVVQSDGVQPSWSPDGERLAYWGLSPGNSGRILWTVDAEGGEPVKALDDGYLNWNPVWSPDGEYLYFGSDRNGNLSLWRLPIDQSSGEVKGEAQLVPTSSQSSGFWSLSRDGRRIVYAANESKSNLESFPFDPAGVAVTGPETPVTRGSQAVRSCDVSPDGRQIAFHTGFPQEDLFVVGADGVGLRQLTKDRHKDRHPFWSPDGRRLLFYSNRGGTYEAWIVGADGGGLQPVLRPAVREKGEPISFPIWSPDGRSVACTLAQKAAVIDLTQELEKREPRPLPSAGAIGEVFYPASWSPDGGRLAGNMARLDDSVREGIGLFSFRSGAYERLTQRGSDPRWLDDRRLLYLQREGVFTLDLETRRVRKVLAARPSSIFSLISLSPDQSRLFVVRSVHEGDIWLLTLS